MDNVEKRYERRGKVKPCSMDKNDILQLAEIVQETFTKAERDRYFRVSTTIGGTRVFSNSLEDLMAQKDLRDKFNDLSFWIEGWDKKTRLDKTVLLDFSNYAISLNVEGTDPVWVYDKYTNIVKFVNSKRAWYWPIIFLEKYIVFLATILLVINVIISISTKESIYYIDKLGLITLWLFLVFYDTRKIWPYAIFRIKDANQICNKENIFMAGMILVLTLAIMAGMVWPLLK